MQQINTINDTKINNIIELWCTSPQFPWEVQAGDLYTPLKIEVEHGNCDLKTTIKKMYQHKKKKQRQTENKAN